MSPERIFGVDLHMREYQTTPKPAEVVEFDDDAELYKWFQERLSLETTVSTRILCVRCETRGAGFEASLPPEIIQHAIWKPEVYHSLTSNPAGGAAGLLDEPWRFILQTPLDGGPFASLAMSCQSHLIKAIFFYDDDMFDPSKMEGGNSSLSATRGSGVPLITLPHKLLHTHSIHVSRLLARSISRVKEIEQVLAHAERTAPDFGNLTRTLHDVNTELVFVERRSRFEQTICEAIETIVKATKYSTKGTWPALAPEKTAVSSRSFDFESLPRRIQNARATINDLIQQRNANINLELTQASYRIAEATLSDSRSMKTIAIMTMVLLPATAVASIFSMSLFDWSAEDGSGIGSKWLWIYFVVTIPLTGMIVTAWWIWNRRATHVHVLQTSTRGSDVEPNFRDLADDVTTDERADDIEMISTIPK